MLTRLRVLFSQFRSWAVGQPVIALIKDPGHFSWADRERTLALVVIPVLGVALVAGGGVASAFFSPTTVVQNAEVASNNEAVAPAAVEIAAVDQSEPEEYHSIEQYMLNVEEYREALEGIRPFRHWQRNRLQEVLALAEVREWRLLGEESGEACFQQADRVECIAVEALEQLRVNAQVFERNNPKGIGLCYDWFDDVCMSGDWFESREVFRAFISDVKTYVMTGDNSYQELEALKAKALTENSPTYEPSRRASVPVLDDDMHSPEEWQRIVGLLFPDRNINDVIISRGVDESSNGDPGRAGPSDEAGRKWFSENPEGFCIGSSMDGDCFSSQQHYEDAMAQIEEYQRTGKWPGQDDNSDGGSEPAPSDDGGSEPAPSDDGGSEPAPSDDGGSEPAPSDDGGSEPAPSDDGGSEPAPSDDGDGS